MEFVNGARERLINMGILSSWDDGSPEARELHDKVAERKRREAARRREEKILARQSEEADED